MFVIEKERSKIKMVSSAIQHGMRLFHGLAQQMPSTVQGRAYAYIPHCLFAGAQIWIVQRTAGKYLQQSVSQEQAAATSAHLRSFWGSLSGWEQIKDRYILNDELVEDPKILKEHITNFENSIASLISAKFVLKCPSQKSSQTVYVDLLNDCLRKTFLDAYELTGLNKEEAIKNSALLNKLDKNFEDFKKSIKDFLRKNLKKTTPHLPMRLMPCRFITQKDFNAIENEISANCNVLLEAIQAQKISDLWQYVQHSFSQEIQQALETAHPDINQKNTIFQLNKLLDDFRKESEERINKLTTKLTALNRSIGNEETESTAHAKVHQTSIKTIEPFFMHLLKNHPGQDTTELEKNKREKMPPFSILSMINTISPELITIIQHEDQQAKMIRKIQDEQQKNILQEAFTYFKDNSQITISLNKNQKETVGFITTLALAQLKASQVQAIETTDKITKAQNHKLKVQQKFSEAKKEIQLLKKLKQKTQFHPASKQGFVDNSNNLFGLNIVLLINGWIIAKAMAVKVLTQNPITMLTDFIEWVKSTRSSFVNSANNGSIQCIIHALMHLVIFDCLIKIFFPFFHPKISVINSFSIGKISIAGPVQKIGDFVLNQLRMLTSR